MGLQQLRVLGAVVGLGCGLGWAAPARADEPKVTSGVAVGSSASVEGGAKSVVSVRSTGAPVTVAVILDHSVGVGNVGGATATVVTVHYQDVCQSPCTFELDPGLRELSVHGDGVTSAGGQFTLKPGAQPFLVKPGSSTLFSTGYMLVVLGGVAVLVGASVMIADSKASYGLPLTIGGGVGLGAGIALWVVGSTSFEPDPSASPGQRAATRPLGLGLRGSF